MSTGVVVTGLAGISVLARETVAGCEDWAVSTAWGEEGVFARGRGEQIIGMTSSSKSSLDVTLVGPLPPATPPSSGMPDDAGAPLLAAIPGEIPPVPFPIRFFVPPISNFCPPDFPMGPSTLTLQRGPELMQATCVESPPTTALTATVGGLGSEGGRVRGLGSVGGTLATEKSLRTSSGGLEGREVPVERYSSLAAIGVRRGMDVTGVREIIFVDPP